MAKMIIERKKTNICKIGSVRLFPGENVLNEKQIEELKKYKAWDALLKAGVHVAKKALSAQAAVSGDILSLNVADATEAISKLESVNELKKLASDESAGKNRKSILTAISLRIEEIEAELTEE